MQFKIRKISTGTSDLLDVKVRDGSTEIDLGLHNEEERRRLANELQEAIDDLLFGLKPDEA